MATCTTTSGAYRCDREAGHAGECECTPPATKSGPASGSGRASASFRTILNKASGATLDKLGGQLNVERRAGELDAVYRERVWDRR